MPGCKKKGWPVIHHTDEDKHIANRLKSQRARTKKSGIALIGLSRSQTRAHRDSQSCVMAGSTTAPPALVEFQEDASMAIEGEHNSFDHSVIDLALRGHVMHHAGVIQARGSGRVGLGVWADMASVSGSLRRLVFRVWDFSRGQRACREERWREGQRGRKL